MNLFIEAVPSQREEPVPGWAILAYYIAYVTDEIQIYCKNVEKTLAFKPEMNRHIQ